MSKTFHTDPDTGGTKETKLERFDLIPITPLKLLAEHYGKGAQKYEARNWEKGYKWSLSYAALQRHITSFWDGEEVDEDGNLHLVAAAWHCFALLQFAYTDSAVYGERDDRPFRAEGSNG